MVADIDEREEATVDDESPAAEVVDDSAEAADLSLEEDGSDAEADEVEVDPLQKALERIDTLEQAIANRPDDPRVAEMQAMVRGLQSRLDRATSSDPLQDIDPRLSATEGVLTSLADALIANDVVTDESKVALRSALSSLNDARTKRERDAMKAELLQEIRGATPDASSEQQNPDTAAYVAEVQSMSRQLAVYAEAKGVEMSSIDAGVLQFRPGEPLQRAFERVKEHINGLAAEADAPERVANRRRAAGTGTPSRAAAGLTLDDKKEALMRGELPETDIETRRAIAKELGVTL